MPDSPFQRRLRLIEFVLFGGVSQRELHVTESCRLPSLPRAAVLLDGYIAKVTRFDDGKIKILKTPLERLHKERAAPNMKGLAIEVDAEGKVTGTLRRRRDQQTLIVLDHDGSLLELHQRQFSNPFYGRGVIVEREGATNAIVDNLFSELELVMNKREHERER